MGVAGVVALSLAIGVAIGGTARMGVAGVSRLSSQLAMMAALRTANVHKL